MSLFSALCLFYVIIETKKVVLILGIIIILCLGIGEQVYMDRANEKKNS